MNMKRNRYTIFGVMKKNYYKEEKNRKSQGYSFLNKEMLENQEEMRNE